MHSENSIKHPFALVAVADLPIIPELELMIRTFRMYHPYVPIIVVGAGLEYFCERLLGCKWIDYAPDWRFATDFGKKRCVGMKAALEIADYALYADADIIWTAPIDLNIFNDAEVILSKHYITSEGEKKYGHYNSGLIATKSTVFCDFWPKVTQAHPEMYYEQQPLDLVEAEFKTAFFPPGYNVAWWRQVYFPQGFADRLHVEHNNLLIDSDPVVCIHTHFAKLSGAQASAGSVNFYRPFIELVKDRLNALPQYINTIYMIEHLVSAPTRMVNYILWYQCGDQKHQAEIDEACKRNLANPAPDSFTMLVEAKDAQAAEQWKTLKPCLRIVAYPQRPTFGILFACASQEMPGSVIVCANSDCYTDESLHKIKNMDLDGKFLALSRWDNDTLVECPQHSQDAWIFTASDNLRRFAAPFPFGSPGCDNSIAHLMHRHGYEIINDCKTIKIRHLHESKERRYAEVFRPPHLYVHPAEEGKSKVEIREKFGQPTIIPENPLTHSQ